MIQIVFVACSELYVASSNKYNSFEQSPQLSSKVSNKDFMSPSDL